MNVFAKYDEIPSMILQDTCIKETKRNGHAHGQKDGQRENSIPTHKQFAGGIIILVITLKFVQKKSSLWSCLP